MLVDGVWMTGGIAPAFNEKTLRHIVGVPNHIRAWSRSAYLDVGGHLSGLPVADDYELILRSLFKYPAVYIRHMTYIQVGGHMKHLLPHVRPVVRKMAGTLEQLACVLQGRFSQF
jgi:hypothetical protein